MFLLQDLGSSSRQSQRMKPSIPSYVFCSFSLWFGEKSWRTDHHTSCHSLLQNELVSDWGKADCSPLGHGSVFRNKNFGFSHGKQINFLHFLKLSFQWIWYRCSRDELSRFFETRTWLLCADCEVLHSYIRPFVRAPKNTKKLKRERQETYFLTASRPPSFIQIPLESVHK